MFKYFQTNKLKVKFNDTILEEADVVICLSSAVGILIPDEYLGTDIMGKMYDPETKLFYDVEVIVEDVPTEADVDWDEMAKAIMEGVNDVE